MLNFAADHPDMAFRAVLGNLHWSITGRFTGPVTGTPPVNFLLADLLPTLLAKKITAPLLACQ